MIKKITLFFAIITLQFAISQNKNGYWDSVRTTNETITLKAGKRRIIKSEQLPQGATQAIVRITVLDNNQKIASSLVSLLKSIPDPSGISQGSAGAIFLLSTISGDDKCKYAIFTTNKEASDYLGFGETKNACSAKTKPINKDIKIITSNCINQNTTYLWFGFESDNWLMNQKVVLEVVPWIDNTLSTGWNIEAKNKLVTTIKKLSVFDKVVAKDAFISVFLEQISQKQNYNDYTNLIDQEKNTLLALITEQSLQKIGELDLLSIDSKKTAENYYLEGNFEQTIVTIQNNLVLKNKAEAIDYNLLGYAFIMTKQYSKAEQCFQTGIALDTTEIALQLGLAHTYMFTNKIAQAKEIHKQYKNQNVSAKISWVQQTKTDFELFEKYNLSDQNFKKILRIIN